MGIILSLGKRTHVTPPVCSRSQTINPHHDESSWWLYVALVEVNGGPGVGAGVSGEMSGERKDSAVLIEITPSQPSNLYGFWLSLWTASSSGCLPPFTSYPEFIPGRREIQELLLLLSRVVLDGIEDIFAKTRHRSSSTATQ